MQCSKLFNVLVVFLSFLLLAQCGTPIYRGVATDEFSGGCADLQALDKISWYWNYGTAPKANVANCNLGRYVEFVPMIWGKSQAQQTDIASKLPAGTKHLFAFNEPNFQDQSNLSPSEAATLWKGVIQQLDAAGLTDGIKFGTPSASPGGSDPDTWLRQFLDACTGCRFDFVTLHNYDCNGQYFNGASTMYWVDRFHRNFSLPIWLTEFSCPGASVNESMELRYMKDLLDRLDTASYVERYSWFTARPTNLGSSVPALFNAGAGSLTNVGIEYNSKGDILPEGGSTTSSGSNSGSNSAGGSSSSASSLFSFFNYVF